VLRVIAARLLFTSAALLLAAMAGALLLQVLSREFQLAVDETEELSRFFFIAMVFLASAYATLRRRHLRVSVFSDAVARRIGERPVAIFHLIVLIGFDCALVWYSAMNFLDGLRFPNISPSLGFNQNNLFIVMCIGFAASALINFADLVSVLRGRGGGLSDGTNARASEAGS